MDHATPQAQAKGVTPTISQKGGQHPTFARSSQNVVTAAMLLDTLPAPFTDEVDRLYRHLGDILAITTTQQVECSLQHRATVSAPNPGCSKANKQKTTAGPSMAGTTSSLAWVSSQGPPQQPGPCVEP
jgi:hypothetical protein